MRFLIVLVSLILCSCMTNVYRSHNVGFSDDKENVGKVVGTASMSPGSLNVVYFFKKYDAEEYFSVETGQKMLDQSHRKVIGKIFEFSLKPGKYHFYGWNTKELVSYRMMKHRVKPENVDSLVFEVKKGEKIYIGDFFLDASFVSREEEHALNSGEISLSDSFKFVFKLLGGEYNFYGFSINDFFKSDINFISEELDSSESYFENSSHPYSSKDFYYDSML